MLFISMIVSWN